MKYLILLILPFLVISCCGDSEKHSENDETAVVTTVQTDEGAYGANIDDVNAVDANKLAALMTDADELELTMNGTIADVCQMSGCWIDVEIADGDVVHVTFAEESFVVPKDIAGKTVLIEGVASKEIIPVDLLKRQAKSEGKTQEEIDAISEPLIEYAFTAEGVKIID